jgi:YD repeat-containing protein
VYEVVPILLQTDVYDIRDENNIIHIETREEEWETSKYTMRLASNKVTRGNENYLENTYEYDHWGNIRYAKKESVSNGRTSILTTWSKYYDRPYNSENETALWKSYPYTIPRQQQMRRNLLQGTITENRVPTAGGGEENMYLHTYYCYNENGQLTRKADWTGLDDPAKQWAETQYEYNDDDYNRLTSITSPEGRVTSMSYDEETYDPLYTITTTAHDIAEPDGNTNDITTVTAYEKATGLKRWEQNPRGFRTSYTYDAIGRLAAIVQPDDDSDEENNPTTSIEYYDPAYKTTVTYPRGNEAVYDYDKAGRLEEIVKGNSWIDESGNTVTGTPAQVTTSIDYDAWDNITAITNPNEYTTHYEYDSMDRLIRITHPGEGNIPGPERSMIYNYFMNTLHVTDEEGNVTSEVYDMEGKLLKRIQYIGIEDLVTTAYYDSLGNAIITEDPAGNMTINKYNCRNLLEQTILPEEEFYEDGVFTAPVSPVVNYEYNLDKQKVKDILEVKGNPYEIAYKNDGFGRVYETKQEFVNYKGETSEVIQKVYYDANGNQVKTVDPEGNETQYTYSARDQMVAVTDPALNMTTYEYDVEDNAIKMTGPRGNVLDNGSLKYTHSDFSIHYTYDGLKRLTNARLPIVPGESQPREISLDYDARGNLLSRTEPDGGQTAYTYTPRNQVGTVTIAGQTADNSALSYTTTYAYDDVGNEIEVL